MSQPFAIYTEHLTRRFGTQRAVDDLNLHIMPGSIYGFIGPNGAGKTTTLRMLAGLLEPSSGSIRLNGTPLTDQSAARSHVGYMPDFFGVYDDLRVWEYLDFYARCHNIEPQRRRSTVDSLLDLVDLAHKRNAFVQHLSRGMQQRLCLAHALVHDPPILLLDEPASGLDPQARLELRELLRTLREMNKTIILSSHILTELEDICTEIGIMVNGQLRASGSIQELRKAGRERLQVVLLEPDERALALLRDQPGVVQAHGEDDANVLTADFHGSNADAAAVLQALTSAGLIVVDFHRQTDNLELMFLRLVNGEAVTAEVNA